MNTSIANPVVCVAAAKAHYAHIAEAQDYVVESENIPLSHLTQCVFEAALF